jgi:hypothetical protein
MVSNTYPENVNIVNLIKVGNLLLVVWPGLGYR